jgi:deoxycytidylate deaminase
LRDAVWRHNVKDGLGGNVADPNVSRQVIKRKTAPNSLELFDAKQKIRSSHTSELVIALCGPIGSPLHKVASAFKSRLIGDFGYEQCEIIRLSKIIEQFGSPAPEGPRYARTKALIESGDDLRKRYGSSILAELAISQIVLERQKAKEKAGAESYSPRRVCHIIDSIKNQEELDILQLVYRDMVYFVGVYAPLPARVKSLEREGMSQKEIYDLIDQDSGEELAHGQTVRDTFPNADCFLRIDTDTDTQISARVERFLHLILGTKVITPTSSETAMYLAASAAGNSACLSRQVGAALTDSGGEIISVGWNDVPKFNGNLYTSDPKIDPNSDRDKRCWNIDGGVCFNDQEKSLISNLLVDELIDSGIIDKQRRSIAIKSVLDNSKVRNLIEFSRSIHAEMHAILTGSQLAGDRVPGGKLFITTYPCHSCARHIIAAGIKEVYYIEPYRKSLATKLHSDAITEDESDQTRVRVLPYDGIAPTRYMRLFRVPKDSRKSAGKMIKVDPKASNPRFDKTLEALPALEALVVKGLREKKLIEAEEHNA